MDASTDSPTDITAAAAAAAAAPAPSLVSEPRRPPAGERGVLTKRSVNIPGSQAALLSQDSAWVSNIGKPGMVFKAVPDKVMSQLRKQGVFSDPSPSSSQDAAEPRPKSTTPPAAESPAAPTSSMAADHAATPTRLPEPQAPPSPPTNPAAISAAVSAAFLPNTPENGPETASQNIPDATAAPSARSQPAPPHDALASPASAFVPASAPAAAATSQFTSAPAQVPVRPSSPASRQPTASASPKRSDNSPLNAVEPTARGSPEIPATPEQVHSPQQTRGSAKSQHSQKDTSYHSPEWPSQLLDDEEAEEVPSHPPSPQVQAPSLRVSIPTPSRTIFHGRSPDLSSSPVEDLQVDLPDALDELPQQQQQHNRDARALGPTQVTQSAQRTSQYQPRSSPSPIPRQRSQRADRSPANSIVPSTYNDADAMRLSAVAASPSTVEAPAQPRRRRLMKAPVFPALGKQKAAAPARQPSATPSFASSPVSSRRSSLTRLYVKGASPDAHEPSTSPTSPVSSNRAPYEARETTVSNEERTSVSPRVSLHGNGTKTPIGETKSPIAATKTPAVVSKTPIVATTTPIVTTRTSIVAAKTPVVTEAPVVVSRTPIVTTKTAIVTKLPVVESNSAAVSKAEPKDSESTPTIQTAQRASPAPAPAPAPTPAHTWRLPYDTFTAAYPDYRGDLEEFLQACYCVQGFAKTGSLATFLFDDVVRAYLDFKEYVQADASSTPLNLLKWYHHHVEALQYSKKVVTKENVAAILAAYPEKVQSIRQIMHDAVEANNIESVKNRQAADKSAAVAAAAAAAAAREPVPPEHSFPAGRRLPDDNSHHNHQQHADWPSQEDDGSTQSNSLLRLTVLGASGSTGESSWLHGQPSSPQPQPQPHALFGGTFADGDTSQSQGPLSQEPSSRDQSQLRRPAAIPASSAQEPSSSPLQLPSSLLPTAAIPPGMDRLRYLLQSPPQQQSQAFGSADSELCWPGDDEEGVAETPARRSASGRKRGREEFVRPATTPTAKAPTATGSESQRQLEKQREAWRLQQARYRAKKRAARTQNAAGGGDGSAAEPAAQVPAPIAKDKVGGAPQQQVRPPTVQREERPKQAIPATEENGRDSSDEEDDDFETSMISIQSAREAARPPAARPPAAAAANDKRRRVTIAAPDIGMAARLAAQAEAEPVTKRGLMTTVAAATGEPPQKKRRQSAQAAKGGAAGGKRSFSSRFAELLQRKKAEEMGTAKQPWMGSGAGKK